MSTGKGIGHQSPGKGVAAEGKPGLPNLLPWVVAKNVTDCHNIL